MGLRRRSLEGVVTPAVALVCRLCGAELRHDLRRPRLVAARELLRRARRRRPAGSGLPAARSRVRRRASWSSCPPSSRRRASSASTRTSRRTRSRGSSMRAGTSSRSSSGSGSARGASSSRSRATTAICSSSSSRSASPCSGSSRRATSPPSHESGAFPRVEEFLGREVGERLAREHGRADLVVANNVLAHVARPPRLHRRPPCSRRRRRRAHSRVPASPAADREARVRHDLPRALLLPLARSRSSGSSREHGLELFDVEELPNARGLGADLRRARSRRAVDGACAWRELREREEAAGSAPARDVHGVRRGSRARSGASCCAFLEEASERRRARSPPTAPRRRATRCSTTAASTRGLVEYVADRSPHKQGRYLPGSRLPIHAPEHVGETRPDYLLLLAWNLRDEIVEQMGWIREWGGRFVVPDPRGRGHRLEETAASCSARRRSHSRPCGQLDVVVGEHLVLARPARTTFTPSSVSPIGSSRSAAATSAFSARP